MFFGSRAMGRIDDLIGQGHVLGIFVTPWPLRCSRKKKPRRPKHQQLRQQSPLRAVAIDLQLPSLASPVARNLSAMFRNALRQSTRAVGAISATSRVAAVSDLPPAATISISSRRAPWRLQFILKPTEELN